MKKISRRAFVATDLVASAAAMASLRTRQFEVVIAG
jgi:hypothetical protein